MPRLLIVCEYPTLLGGERSMLATLSSVAAAGFDIAIAAPREGQLADAVRARGLTDVVWDTADQEGRRFSLEQLRDSLTSIVRKARPDLVHANSLSTARIAGPVASRLGVRSIGHLRDIIKLTRQAIDDLNLHTRLVAVSAATRDFHAAQGLDASKCSVLNNGVDLDLFSPRHLTGHLHQQLGLPTSVLLVAVIGQLGLRKGTDIALTAALQVAEQVPNVHWLIVGERTSNKPESEAFEAKLYELANRPPLAGRVHFLGTRSDVPQWLSDCTLLVHAARQEPLGRVLLEAAACGVAIVATDVGGTPEIFAPECNAAMLVQPDAPEELATAIATLLNDTDRRHVLGTAARRRAEQAFDIRIVARRLTDLYSEVLRQ